METALDSGLPGTPPDGVAAPQPSADRTGAQPLSKPAPDRSAIGPRTGRYIIFTVEREGRRIRFV